MEPKAKRNVRLKGVGVSSGIIICRALLVDQGKIELATYSLKTKKDIDKETQLFLQAIANTKQQFIETQKELKHKGYKEAGFILDAYLMILEDDMLIRNTATRIQREKINAAWALKNTLKELQNTFAQIEDEYLRERRSDLEYVGKRILQNLGGSGTVKKNVAEKVIIVAHDLSPADTTHLDLDKVVGFVTDIGGATSHTAIMARALQIPAVVGLETATKQIRDGETVVLDGVSGTVIINPSPSVFKEYSERRQQHLDSEKELLKFRPLLAETRDGYRVKLLANIEITEELPALMHHGAEGIGLYRTEFLYLSRTNLPSEEDHFQTYRKVIEAISPNPTTIRTFDLGGDKFLSRVPMAEEMNPALGLRAIRFCLREVEVFKTQLRAILRASALGKVRILFPMISGVQEIHQIKEIMGQVRDDLSSRGIPFDHNLEVGIMIEIPSAVVIADLLAQEVDFFSIGTNDLIQYLLAIDRVNEHVSYLYKPLHPAVLRILKRTVEVAHAAGITVNMCGEMAGEPFYTPILLGFGIDELSMNALSLLRVKKMVRSANYRECQHLTEELLQLSTPQEVESYMQRQLHRHFAKALSR